MWEERHSKNPEKYTRMFKKQQAFLSQTSMNDYRLKAKSIFMDLDGTLVDSTEAYIEAARFGFEAIGKRLPENIIPLEFPRRIEQGLPINDLTGGNTLKFQRAYFAAYYSLTEAKTKLIPNVSSTLKALSKNVKLALITMRHIPNQVMFKELDYLGIAQYFNHIVTALDTCMPKPSPEPLFRCAQALGLRMCDCIIAGDSLNDVRAGKAAGTKTVAVLSGLFCHEELSKECPDLILPDINSLPRYIE